MSSKSAILFSTPSRAYVTTEVKTASPASLIWRHVICCGLAMTSAVSRRPTRTAIICTCPEILRSDRAANTRSSLRLRKPDSFLSLLTTDPPAYSSSLQLRKHGSVILKTRTHNSTVCWQRLWSTTSRITVTASTTLTPSTSVWPFQYGGESIRAC